ncbi:Tn3 family transposase [Streptomyces sp. NPDC094048]|uniref:Tn3 family transposase n=1 Tax=Streptomyces sp. NPDC094048 TaxID=3155207 RepID=UPI003322C4FC
MSTPAGGQQDRGTRLGLCLMLKFFEIEGRFPICWRRYWPPPWSRSPAWGKPAADFAKCSLTGRTTEYHRAQVREALGFRPATPEDEEQLTAWPAAEVCPVELVEDRHGKGGALTGPDKKHAETSMLALHLLQSSLAHISTLLLQQALAEPAWAKKPSNENRHGLTAPFWSNINPYGTLRLGMDKRLDLGLSVSVSQPGSRSRPQHCRAERVGAGQN